MPWESVSPWQYCEPWYRQSLLHPQIRTLRKIKTLVILTEIFIGLFTTSSFDRSFRPEEHILQVVFSQSLIKPPLPHTLTSSILSCTYLPVQYLGQ